MSFCPHCNSRNDPVLKDTTWSCGVRFNDSIWRTKECYKRQIYVQNEHLRLQEQHISELEEEHGRLKQRIKQLEESENRMLNWLTEDCPESVKKQLSNAWMKSKEAKP